MIYDTDKIAEIYRLNRETFFGFIDGIGNRYSVDFVSGHHFLSSWTVEDAVMDFLTNPQVPDHHRTRSGAR